MNRRQFLAGLGSLVGTAFGLESLAGKPTSPAPKKLPNVLILDMEGRVRDYTQTDFPILDIPYEEADKYPSGVVNYLRGVIKKPALLAFSHYHCGPCIRDMDDLNAMYNDPIISQHVAIVGVNLISKDESLEESIANTKSVLEQQKVRYPNLMMPLNYMRTLFVDIGLEGAGIPQNVLVDQNQNILYICGVLYSWDLDKIKYLKKNNTNKALLIDRIKQLQ